MARLVMADVVLGVIFLFISGNNNTFNTYLKYKLTYNVITKTKY